jgi:hypothetical protein
LDASAALVTTTPPRASTRFPAIAGSTPAPTGEGDEPRGAAHAAPSRVSEASDAPASARTDGSGAGRTRNDEDMDGSGEEGARWPPSYAPVRRHAAESSTARDRPGASRSSAPTRWGGQCTAPRASQQGGIVAAP